MALHEIDIWDRALQRIGDQRIFPDLAATKVTSGSDATAADPVVVTATDHGYSTGDLVLIRGFTQMTEVNGRVFQVTSTGDHAFSLDDEDGSGYTAETTGGNTYKLPSKNISNACFDAWKDIRDEVLQEHPWNKCVKRTRLARLEAAKNITGATAANPVVITSSSHGYSNGDLVLIEAIVGMTELNGRWFTVANKVAGTYELASEDGTDYTAYGSGGTSKKAHNAPYKSDTEYAYRYTVPTDKLRILGLVNSKSLWVIEGSELFTDDGITVPIRYIFQQKDVTQYSPLLDSVMAARMVAELTELLTPDARKVESAMIKYDRILAKAKRADGLEQSPMPLGEDDWIDARDGYIHSHRHRYVTK